MNDDENKIVVARRQDGRIVLLGGRTAEQQLQRDWDWIRIDRTVIPDQVNKAQLWDYIVEHYEHHIQSGVSSQDEVLTIDNIRRRQELRIREKLRERFLELDGKWHKAYDEKNRPMLKAIKRLRKELREIECDVNHLDDPYEIAEYYPIELRIEPKPDQLTLSKVISVGIVIIAVIGSAIGIVLPFIQ